MSDSVTLNVGSKGNLQSNHNCKINTSSLQYQPSVPSTQAKPRLVMHLLAGKGQSFLSPWHFASSECTIPHTINSIPRYRSKTPKVPPTPSMLDPWVCR
ncbi:hypothetical protein ACRALDRAFT_206529 [Sodiomyces alcalophilus JCM 7366]|uniref:uncharacterized protein n=1 Tax=Sodiomyces alcalophilus JCM 7366 TaxID=591952 RepID=UPI0039B4F06F